MKALSLLLLSLIIVDQVDCRDLGKGPISDPLPPIGPRVYECFQFPDNRLPTIDGDLTDWEIVGDGYAQDTYQLIEYNRQIGRKYDFRDFDMRVRTGYSVSANRIYVAVERWDDYHNFDRVTKGRAELGRAGILPGRSPGTAALILLGWTVALSCAVVWRYRRDSART